MDTEVDVNARVNGSTPLNEAIFHKKYEDIVCLLALGANPYIKKIESDGREVHI
jgi:ankyrin repeat protein